jgi:hypothetical protein
MPLTTQNIYTVLVSRCKGKLQAAGMSVLTTNNPDLIDPVTTALSIMGYHVATFGALVDADIQQVPVEAIAELLDRSQLQTLINVKGNLNRVDIKTARREERLNQLEAELGKDIKVLAEKIDEIYVPANSADSLQAGSMLLDFQQKFDDEVGS